MNSLIMQWSSSQMYEGRLVAHSSVSDRVFGDLLPADESRGEDDADNDVNSQPLIYIDTAGSLMYEAVDQEIGKNESKYNVGEVDLVIQMIKELISVNLQEKEIGVITPYSAQVSEIRKQLKHLEIGQGPGKKIEVSTVDGFQGREKEVIIISMVRSNAQNQIGFLSNEKRMNVAVTRAKRLCCLIGDSGTVSSNSFLASLCAYFR